MEVEHATSKIKPCDTLLILYPDYLFAGMFLGKCELTQFLSRLNALETDVCLIYYQIDLVGA